MKDTNNNQALTLSCGTAVVKPKPTKGEILDALVKLRIEQMQAANLAIQKKIDDLAKEIEPGVKRWLSGNIHACKPSLNYGYMVGSPRHLVSVGVDFSGLEKLLPETLLAMIKQRHSLQEQIQRIPPEKDLREEIKNGIELRASKNDRVNALLNDKDARSQLTTILEKIGRQ